jgi:hypothetical protein
MYSVSEDSEAFFGTCAGVHSIAKQPVLQLPLDGPHEAEALGTDQGVRPVRRATTCSYDQHPSGIMQGIVQGFQVPWATKTISPVGGVLCRNQRRLSEDDVTRCNVLHVQL